MRKILITSIQYGGTPFVTTISRRYPLNKTLINFLGIYLINLQYIFKKGYGTFTKLSFLKFGETSEEILLVHLVQIYCNTVLSTKMSTGKI